MLKLSEIGKLSQQFANTCCYKNLQSHILASRKCCPNGSSQVSAAKTAANEPIRINHRAGLCQLGRNDIRCCTACNEINQCIWSASKNSSFYVPDQATPWYEKQRENRLNRHTLLEQCQCYGISSFVPPEECLKLRARQCMKPLDPSKYKRISPEFLKLLQNYEYLMASYDPKVNRSGYCKPPAKVFLPPSEEAKGRSQSEGKSVRYAHSKGRKRGTRSKTRRDSPKPLIGGHPKAHAFDRPARVFSDEKMPGTQASAAKDSKNTAPKSESGKTSTKPSQQLVSSPAGTSKAAKQGKNEKKRWSLFAKENKENNSQKSKSKSSKSSPVRELWAKPNTAEMRESGGSIDVYRSKSKHRRVEDINTDTYDEASEGSLIKLRPQIRYHVYKTSHKLPEQSRGRRGKSIPERTSSTLKYRSVSDREQSDSPLDLKPRVHGNFDDTEVGAEKKRSSPKTSICQRLWSSRSASTDRERLAKQRSHSLHSKEAVTELNPTVHGYSQYRDVGSYRSSPPKARRRRSPSPSKSRISSDRDDDSDVSLAPRVHKFYNVNHVHKTYPTSCKRTASPPPLLRVKSCKRSASKREKTGSMAPRVHAYRGNERDTKHIRERSLSTAPESSSCSRSKNKRLYHPQFARKRSPLSTTRGRARKKAISTSASTDSLAPRLHGFRSQQTKCSKREKNSYSASRNQLCHTPSPTPLKCSTRKHRRSPSNSDSMASIGPPQLHGYRLDQPKNRVSLLEPPDKKPLRNETSPMKNKTEHISSASKFKSAVYLRPGLHGYRNHALTIDEDKQDSKKSAKKKHTQLASPTNQNQRELSQHSENKQQPTALEQTKRKPPKHTTIAAFTAHIQYNPDKQDLYYECNKSSSAHSISSLRRSHGSSSPLTSDSSHSIRPKLKSCMGRGFSKSRCSNCQAQKQHCFCNSSKNDPRFQQLQKIHHYQDVLPEKHSDPPSSRPEKYVNSSSILRKCCRIQEAQSDTGLSSECEERFTRFSETSNKISKQSCCPEIQQANICQLPINQERNNHIQCGYMSDLSKFNAKNWPNDRIEPDGSQSSQDCDEECMRRKNSFKHAPRGDTSPNAKRHENCYKDSINWTYADEQFPSRYRLQGEKAAEEADLLERHKARNRSKSRLYSPSSEEQEEQSVSRHKACSKDAYDWSEATQNYPIRYQQAAKDAAAERAWRAKHMKKMHSRSNCSSEAADRHTLCSRDAFDWAEVTENYPVRYREAAARQEADRVMLERHTAKRRSRSPNPKPGVCPERHTACFNDSTDWRNATMNYPIRYRIAALEAAAGRKFHTRRNLWDPRKDQSSSPNSSPSRSPNRNVAPTSPDKRQRLRSPSRNEDDADDRGLRKQKSPLSHAESKEDSYLRRRYPTRYEAQEKCRSRENTPANFDDNEASQHRYKIAAGGYYKSPSYLSDPSKSRIPIANKYSPLKQSNSSQKEADSREHPEPAAGKENKPTARKQKSGKICSQLRPDYILGQRQTFRS